MQIITTDEPSVREFQDWLQRNIDGLTKFDETFSSLQNIRGLVTTLWPLGISLSATFLSFDNFYQAFWKSEYISLRTLQVMVGLIFTLVWLHIFVTDAFYYKQQLFRLNRNLIPKHKLQPDQETIENVYQIEDRLFNLIGKKKAHEFPISALIWFLILTLFGILIIIFANYGLPSEIISHFDPKIEPFHTYWLQNAQSAYYLSIILLYLVGGVCLILGILWLKLELEKKYLFSTENEELEKIFVESPIPDKLMMTFQIKGYPLSAKNTITRGKRSSWVIRDERKEIIYVIGNEEGILNVYKSKWNLMKW